MMGQIYVSSLGISGFWVFRVPEFNTRITRINFGYRGLLPKILIGFFEFGFFGYGFRVSGNMPSPTCCRARAAQHPTPGYHV